MENSSSWTTMFSKPHRARSTICTFSAIVGLQLLSEAAFGFMSPIISIVLTEYFARLHRQGLPIDCGANPHDEACIDGSRQAAWLSSIYAALGSVLNFIVSPMIGQLSDFYGRKMPLVLSQLARIGVPFSVMYLMQPQGSTIPYFVFRVVDNGFGTAGVLGAAVADIIPIQHRAGAFGILSASVAIGYCTSAFIAAFFSREHILQISVGLFALRIVWALCLLPETLPTQTRGRTTRFAMENPVRSISILFRNKLFTRLTCLIALTSFVMEGVFQVQPFYLNTVVGFNVKDFGNLMLVGGVLAMISQGLLLDPLVSYAGEKGVIVAAMVSCFARTCGVAGTALYPHKWVVFVLCLPTCLGELAFPAISALQSINSSDEEQGRLQGAIYGACSVFEAVGPVVFSVLYATMTRKSIWSQALPFVVASCIYLVGVGVAISLPAGKHSSRSVDDEALLLSLRFRETPFSKTEPERESGIGESNGIAHDSRAVLDDEYTLSEPLLETSRI